MWPSETVTRLLLRPEDVSLTPEELSCLNEVLEGSYSEIDAWAVHFVVERQSFLPRAHLEYLLPAILHHARWFSEELSFLEDLVAVLVRCRPLHRRITRYASVVLCDLLARRDLLEIQLPVNRRIRRDWRIPDGVGPPHAKVVLLLWEISSDRERLNALMTSSTINIMLTVIEHDAMVLRHHWLPQNPPEDVYEPKVVRARIVEHLARLPEEILRQAKEELNQAEISL